MPKKLRHGLISVTHKVALECAVKKNLESAMRQFYRRKTIIPFLTSTFVCGDFDSTKRLNSPIDG